MVHAKVVVMQATLYDVLVGGAILYPLGITLDFWEDTAYYQPGWQKEIIIRLFYQLPSLGDMHVDAITICSRAHRFRWLWINLAPLEVL
jgi:hypothetical protein